MQPLAGQPQRLGLKERIAAARQFLHEPRRPVRGGDLHPPHGLVEEFARRLGTDHSGIVEHIRPQPRDPYLCGQWPGSRAPRRTWAAVQAVAQSLVELCQEEIGLRRSGE